MANVIQQLNKTYNAILELKKPERKAVCDELDKIANGKLNENYEREVKETSNYIEFWKKYCVQNMIEMEAKWDFVNAT